MRIGIYGGSFNPPHKEHVAVAAAAVEKLDLDKLFVVPAFLAPHKSGDLMATSVDRLNMCHLSFDNVEKCEVSDEEVARRGISYTYVTVGRFREMYPDAEIFLVLGADMFADFPTWRETEIILASVTVAVAEREGEDIEDAKKAFKKQFKCDFVEIGYTGANVSSTKVRVKAALKEDVSDLVAPGVGEYIKDNKLYRLTEDVASAKKMMKGSRWRHCVNVAVLASENRKLAKAFEQDAIMAGALHDCAKNLPESSPYLAGFVPPEGIPEPVMHQFSGAYVAEHTFGIMNENILNAIRYHTTGRAGMASFEKLIYLSDLLEESRDFEGIEEIRRAFKTDLDEAMYLALCHEMKYLETQDRDICPLTKEAYEFEKAKREESK